MAHYDYYKAVSEDIRSYIENNDIVVTSSNRERLEERLRDELFCDDSVTGNASGSYTFNCYQAEEYLCHNWDLLEDALNDFYCEENPIAKGAEWCDVTIRCYVLSQCLGDVLDELEVDDEEDDEE